MDFLRRNAIALLALFVALGGASYAAIRVPANSVGTKQIRNGSLLARDFRAGQLPKGAKGDRGPQGLRGPKGDAGATGVAGPPGLDNIAVTRAEVAGNVQTTGATVADAGPSVTVDVPSGALVMAYAEADVLFDGSIPGNTAWVQLLNSNSADDQPKFFIANDRIAAFTLESLPFIPDPVGRWVIVHASPGTHTFSLAYGNGSAQSTATFSNRKLWIAVLPTATS